MFFKTKNNSFTRPLCFRSRDMNAMASNWNATTTSSDGKAVLWNLDADGEYEIMVSCRDETSGESLFSRSILTRPKGKNVSPHYILELR